MKELKRYEIPLLGKFEICYKGNDIEFKDCKRFLCFKDKYLIIESNDFDDLQKQLRNHTSNLYEKESRRINDEAMKLENIKMSKDFSGDNWLDNWEIK